MPADTFSDFYRRHVEHCARAGVEPVAPERAVEVLSHLGPLNPSAAFVMGPDVQDGGDDAAKW